MKEGSSSSGSSTLEVLLFDLGMHSSNGELELLQKAFTIDDMIKVGFYLHSSKH